MPSTLISTREGWIDDANALFDAVQVALADTIGVSRTSKAIRLLEFPARAFTLPAGRGERYTLIEIALLPGRTREQKQSLYAALGGALERFGVGAGDFKVILTEVPAEHWS